MSEARAEIRRDAYTRFGTLGELTVYGHDGRQAFRCLTAENPDRGNQPSISCIPESSDYILVPSRFHRGGYDCWQILRPGREEIPGRTLVKVHRGNVADDVEGCVVLGFFPITHRGQWGVGPSGGPNGAFTRFMQVMGELDVDQLPLTIYYRKG